MVTEDELEEFLAIGHEIRSFEVKGPGNLTDKAYCAKVARAVMAMGNLRDGGLVCLGIDETRMREMKPGLNDNQLGEWSTYDDVADALSRYSDPPATFELGSFTLSSGAAVVVLEVAEFDDTPHVCKRDHQNELRKGTVYVRPRGKPESVMIPSSTEMRELLDLAITKGVREFIRRAGAAGIQLGGPTPPEVMEREAYQREAEAAWMDTSAVLDTILGSGYTDVAIRPGAFDPGRLAPTQLERLVIDNTVRLRGWPVPYIDGRIPLQRHGTWIGQDIEPRVVPHIEAWRMCASGQFLHRRVLATDLRDDAQLLPSVPGATGTVAVWDVLLYAVEVAEFGARLLSALNLEEVTFDVSLRGIAGRELISGTWERELDGPYLIAAETLSSTANVGSTKLLAATRAVGVELAQALLRQFGLDLPNQILADWQDHVLTRP